jgi:hypothetical protein
VSDGDDPVLALLGEILGSLTRIEALLAEGASDEERQRLVDDSQSVIHRTWDAVSGRWVYTPEPG